jgi:hypothetical protein
MMNYQKELQDQKDKVEIPLLKDTLTDKERKLKPSLNMQRQLSWMDLSPGIPGYPCLIHIENSTLQEKCI